MVNVREAKPEESFSICNVLIESIKNICAPYYEYDENIISEWLENKTPDNVRRWIESNSTYCLVAEKANGTIVGFACISDGEIMLNYVIPEVLHKGVGKEMLKKLELHAYSTGVRELHVVSSLSAKEFYERNGYVANGNPEYVGPILGDFPLVKRAT